MKKEVKIALIVAAVVLVFLLALVDFDFSAIGSAVGMLVGTILRYAIPIGIVVLIVWLIKRKKK